jgi:hypothetical protein
MKATMDYAADKVADVGGFHTFQMKPAPRLTKVAGAYHSRGEAALLRAHAKQYVAPSTSQDLSPHMLERIARLRKTERNRRKKLNNRRNRAAQ